MVFARTTYLRVEIITLKLTNLVIVKLFSLLIITSYGVGIMTWEFGRIALLCLLYLPTPVRGKHSINTTVVLGPAVFEISFHDY